MSLEPFIETLSIYLRWTAHLAPCLQLPWKKKNVCSVLLRPLLRCSFHMFGRGWKSNAEVWVIIALCDITMGTFHACLFYHTLWKVEETKDIRGWTLCFECFEGIQPSSEFLLPRCGFPPASRHQQRRFPPHNWVFSLFSSILCKHWRGLWCHENSSRSALWNTQTSQATLIYFLPPFPDAQFELAMWWASWN